MSTSIALERAGHARLEADAGPRHQVARQLERRLDGARRSPSRRRRRRWRGAGGAPCAAASGVRRRRRRPRRAIDRIAAGAASERLADHERETPEGTAVAPAAMAAGTQGTKVRGVPAASPAIVVSRTSRARASGSSVGRQPAAAAEHRRAGQRRPQHVQRLLRDRASAGKRPASMARRMRAATRSSICCSNANPCHCSLIAGTAAVDEHQMEELPVVLRELVEGPPAAAQVVDRVGARRRRPRSPGRGAGSLPRPARRRCRPCWGSSCRSPPGCIRCARRSCGSRPVP